MKKRTLGSVLISAAMGLSLFASGALGAQQEGATKDTYRVYIQGHQSEKGKAKQTYGWRWDFGKDGFTTTVNESQYNALLKNKNLSIQLVEEVSLEDRTEANAKPGVSAQALPSDQTPWGIQAIYNDSSVQKTSGGTGIKVAVLDTGVYTSHIDLAGSAEQCKDFTQSKSPLVNGSCSDRNGHGTHVAGTVLAHGGSDGLGIYGVAPEADLWA